MLKIKEAASALLEPVGDRRSASVTSRSGSCRRAIESGDSNPAPKPYVSHPCARARRQRIHGG
jgi:hypothetical protein